MNYIQITVNSAITNIQQLYVISQGHPCKGAVIPEGLLGAVLLKYNISFKSLKLDGCSLVYP